MPGLESGRGCLIRARGCMKLVTCLALLLGVQGAACSRTSQKQPAQQAKAVSRPDINQVLRVHDRQLLAIPGVVGVYVGVLNDGKTPCLKVMVARKTQELEQKIPKSLDGYPVVTEETGVIRPMPKK